MKTTFEIITETAKVFYRFSSEMPKNYMQEIFGKDDEVLAEKCLQAPKYGMPAMLRLIRNLNSDERQALARYINKKNREI
jgi:hypothetical protein